MGLDWRTEWNVGIHRTIALPDSGRGFDGLGYGREILVVAVFVFMRGGGRLGEG